LDEPIVVEKKKNKFSFSKFFSNASSSKKIKLVIAGVLFIVVILIFFSGIAPANNNSSTKVREEVIVTTNYAEETEVRLKNILSNINGIGDVDVFVYVTSSPEIVYLKETESQTNQSSSGQQVLTQKETIVFDKNGNLSSAVVVVTKYPKIEGILIVASGANDVKLKLKIIDAVSCILSIAPTNIEVLEGKS